MSNISIPQNFGPLPSIFQGQTTNELGAGIATSMAVVGYKGKVWSIKFGGNNTALMRDDGDGPRASIEVIMVRGATHLSKNYYASGFVDGSTAAPDCSSSNGVTPDVGAPKKQSNSCSGCPQDAWGSRVSESGKPGKACADSKRLVVVPAGDIENEAFGGPMLLRVPAASLKDLKAFAERLEAMGYPSFGIVTRIAFDHEQAYPKFVFTAIRALDEKEAHLVMKMREDPRTHRILNEAEPTDAVTPPPPPPKPESFFEQPPKAPPVVPTQAALAAPAPVAPAPTVATPSPAPVQSTPATVSPSKLPPHDPVTGEVEEDEDERLLRLAQERIAAKKAAATLAAARTAAQEAVAMPDPTPAATSLAPEKFEKLLDGLL